MSVVPFSLGDIFAAVAFAKEIYTTCFSKASGVKLAYARYGRQIELLSRGLEDLWHILSEHQKQLERRGKRLGMMDLKVLAEIVGDFYGTLDKTKLLLDRYSVFRRDGRGFVTRITWTMDAEKEVQNLTEDCNFHIAKIQFVIQPLKIKLMFDISEQIDNVQRNLTAQMLEIKLLLLNATGKGHGTSLLPVDSGPFELMGEEVPVNEHHPRRIVMISSLEEKFETTFRNHPEFLKGGREVPLRDWAEAAAWWIDKGTNNFVKPFSTPSLQEVQADLYLNLLKATWLLSNCQETRGYLVLEETSLWREYICGLSKSIVDEIRSFDCRGLKAPEEGTLLRLPDKCFHVWLNSPEGEVVLTSRDERPGEQKILSLTLETNSDPDHVRRELLVFRKDEETLRLCDTTENFDNDSRSSEEFTIVYADAQLFPLYITGYSVTRPNFNMMVRCGHAKRAYTFQNNKDVLEFQRAIMGCQTILDQPGLKSVICASRIGSDQTGSSVRVQIWLDKLLTKRTPPTPSTPASDPLMAPSPLSRRYTDLSLSSSGSSPTPTGRQDVVHIERPKVPRLIIFYLSPNKSRWSFVQILMEEGLFIKPKRCCKSINRLYASSVEGTCCSRIVLESNTGLTSALLFEVQRDCVGWELDVLRANVKHARQNGKREAYRYISIDFGSAEHKKSFQVAFEKVKKLFARQMEVVREEVDGWKGGAIARSFTANDVGSHRGSVAGSSIISGSIS